MVSGIGRNEYKHWDDRKTVKMMHELLLTDYNSELGDVNNEVLLAAKIWAKEALDATRQVSIRPLASRFIRVAVDLEYAL